MNMNADDIKRLAHADYWDERYAGTGPDQQLHEWFRGFDELNQLFTRHLIDTRPPTTAPRILHLGSGDSVRNR
jgi:EEF1A lysine methyltransferase 4